MLDHLAKKFHWDEKWLNEGEEKGVEKGVEKRNIEIAKMMLEKGLDIPLIMDITGLTREEIMKLK
jgi:predicted transposase/invertase (TIGR01784 family)